MGDRDKEISKPTCQTLKSTLKIIRITSFQSFSPTFPKIPTTTLSFPQSFPQAVENLSKIHGLTVGNPMNFHRFPQKSLIFPAISPLWIFPLPCGFSFPQTCRIFQATCLPTPPFPQITIDRPGCGKVKILYNRGKFSVFDLSLPTRVWETRTFPIFGQGFSKENWRWIFPANTVFCGFYGFF